MKQQTTPESFSGPPVRHRLQKYIGGTIFVGVVVGTLLLWIVLRPANQSNRLYTGEVLGVLAVVLYSGALVTAMRSNFLESLFGGIDRLYRWHRMSAALGTILLIPHLLFSFKQDPIFSSLGIAFGFLSLLGLFVLVLWALIPRLLVLQRVFHSSYQRWFSFHRFIGLFVIVALIHGILVDPVLRLSPVLWWEYIGIAVVGTCAYLGHELLSPFLKPRFDYRVKAVNRLNPTTLEVVLAPVAQPLSFVAGQFVFVAFVGVASNEYHPFTISSTPQDRDLRLSIKMLGDYTQRLYATLQPGEAAIVGQAFGLFDYRQGGREQIWIAGGIGITPFLSWVRAFPETLSFDIDLYYSVRTPEEALFRDEIEVASRKYPGIHLHLGYSSYQRKLSVQDIERTCSGSIIEKDIYMCGPTAMTTTFHRMLRKRGLSSSQIHFEDFNFR
jgi:predicted ferric reductase